MSWDEDYSEIYRCPCGQGHYKITHRSDDWGQTEESCEMECPRCNSIFGLYLFYSNRKGIAETYFAWAPKPLLDHLAELRSRTKGEKEALAAYLKTRYKERWLQHFNSLTKKAIWKELEAGLDHSYALSTFYSHIRSSGLESVLETYICYEKVETVIRVLKLRDDGIISRLETIKDLEQEAKKKDHEIRERCYYSNSPISAN